MELPEDTFYELATREVTSNRLAVATWGKAFSETAGDRVKAQALYIKLRVDQLTQLLSKSSTEEYLRQLWPEIKRGESFVCPCCKRVTKLKPVETDFLIKLVTGAPSVRYFCTTCNEQLVSERSGGASVPNHAPAERVSAVAPGEKTNSPTAVVGFSCN